MLVGTTVCFGHQQSVLPQGRGLKVPLTDRFLIFEIAVACLCCRTPTARYLDNGERVRQSLSNQVDPVSALDTTARRCSFTVDPHMPSDDRSCRQASSLEKTAKEQPSINA
jgi:hypothetical protein